MGTDTNSNIVRKQISLIISGSLIVFVILLIATRISTHNLEENAKRLENLVTQNNAKYQQLTIMSDSIRERMLIFFDIIHSDDIFQVDSLILESAQRAAVFIQARISLLRLELTSEQRLQIENQKKLLGQSQKIFNALTEKVLEGDASISVEQVQKVRKANAAVLADLENMRNLQIRLGLQELQLAKKANQESKEKITLLGISAFLLSCLVIVFIIHQLKSQGKALAQALYELKGYNITLEQRVEIGAQELMDARADNIRMSAELDINRHLQQIILPTKTELADIEPLDIATYMEPAEEIGGDYLDVLKHQDGFLIGIGDVTGHGLESGIIMLMTQSMVRSQTLHNLENMEHPLKHVNQTLFHNISRMSSDKHLTLLLLNYQHIENADGIAHGQFQLTGQHEAVIIVRKNGDLEIIDTDALGFPVGMVDNIDEFVASTNVKIHSGDLVVLFTDGITEAANEQDQLYGFERLCNFCKQQHIFNANQVVENIINDVKNFIGQKAIYDDLSLVVFKQR